MSGVLGFLPLATLLRAVPTARPASSPSGSTVHLLFGGEDRPLCGRRPRGLALVDVEQTPALRVCTSCARTLPDVTRMHLSTMGRPSVEELAAVREQVVRTEARALLARFTALREDAVIDGSGDVEVVLADAVLDHGGRAPVQHRRVTLAQLIGALAPGAMTEGRLWITDPPPAGTPVGLPGGSIGAVVALTPHPGHKFPPAGGRTLHRGGAR